MAPEAQVKGIKDNCQGNFVRNWFLLVLLSPQTLGSLKIEK